MSLIARTPSHVSSSTSVSPGKRSYGSQDPWSSIAEKEERSGRLDIGIDRMKASDHYYHEQFMESFSKLFKNGMTTVFGLLKRRKLRSRRTTDRSDLIKLLGEWYEKFNLVTRKFFSTEPRNP